MKKVFLLLFLLVSSLVYSDQTFFLETSKGVQKVVIPEGTSTIDAFKDMSLLYLEERFAHEKTIEKTIEETNKLIKEIDDFVILVEDYESKQTDLQEKYDNLIKEYESADNLFSPLFLIGIKSNFIDSEKSLKFSSGLLFKKSLIGTIDLYYPLGIGLSIGKVF